MAGHRERNDKDRIVFGNRHASVLCNLPRPAQLDLSNDLRNADAHLGSSLVASGLERAKVDAPDSHPVEQGRPLLETFVTTVRDVTDAIGDESES